MWSVFIDLRSACGSVRYRDTNVDNKGIMYATSTRVVSDGSLSFLLPAACRYPPAVSASPSSSAAVYGPSGPCITVDRAAVTSQRAEEKSFITEREGVAPGAGQGDRLVGTLHDGLDGGVLSGRVGVSRQAGRRAGRRAGWRAAGGLAGRKFSRHLRRWGITVRVPAFTQSDSVWYRHPPPHDSLHGRRTA